MFASDIAEPWFYVIDTVPVVFVVSPFGVVAIHLCATKFFKSTAFIGIPVAPVKGVT